MLIVGALMMMVTPALAHDIYTGLHGKNNLLCCGGSDCAPTIYRETGDKYEFLTREGEWVKIPEERITWLPIPGDKVDDPETHRAHLCYRRALDGDHSVSGALENVFGPIYLYCAFISPGGV